MVGNQIGYEWSVINDAWRIMFAGNEQLAVNKQTTSKFVYH